MLKLRSHLPQLKLPHLPPAVWFILLYLLGFGGLTLLALLLKGVMNGLMQTM